MQTPSLSRKILLRSVALLLTLLLLGVVAVWSVLLLEQQVRNATKEYSELRQIERAGFRTATAIGLLRSTPADADAAAAELRWALAAVEELDRIQRQGEPEGSTRHEAVETRSIESARGMLREVLAHMSSPPAAEVPARLPARYSEQVAQLRRVQSGLNELAAEADSLVAKTQDKTARGAWNATIAIAATFLIVSAAAILISVLQYRSIMRPLRALRDGVRRIARGKFDQRLPALGEREVIELTGDFNRMAAELEELYRDLEAKVATKSRELVQSERLASVGFLAAGVAHEINNPLGIMSGFAELSLKKLRNGRDAGALDDARRSLQIIRDEAFRCREITEKLLTMARGGGSAARSSAVPVQEVVEDVAAMVAAHAAYRGRRVELELPPEEDLRVFGEASELRQVLLNLCVNALEAADPLTGIVRIRARRTDEDWIELAVEDNGCGMSPQVREHVFEPFFSVRAANGSGPAASSRGVGLGLSITRAIIESAGGTISAFSDGPGRGSRFVARFPSASAGVTAGADAADAAAEPVA